MAQQTPSGIVRQASTLSALWGVALIIFGIVAVASPFLAAVAVNAVIAWLIVMAGVVHIILAFHAFRAGSMLWRLLVGIAYVFFGGYLIARPGLGVALAHFGAGIVVSRRRRSGDRSVLPDTLSSTGWWASARWDHHVVPGADDLFAVAIKFCVGDRNPGRREHDRQRCYASNAVAGGSQDHGYYFTFIFIVSGVSVNRDDLTETGLARRRKIPTL